MKKIFNNISETIGNTPLVRLQKISRGLEAEILAKLESFNPCGSIKDRIALAMIEDGEKAGLIKKGATIVEPTSGNTGIGLAFICAVRDYNLILTMPDNMSLERRKLLSGLGAKIILTPASEGMNGAAAKAEEIASKTPNSYMPNQFKNPANPGIHKITTAEEIWKDTGGKIDIFVAGVGTGGTVSGVGEALKQKKQDIYVVAVEPSDSPVLSGGKAGPHKIQGIGAGFIPQALKRDVIDEVVTARYDQAEDFTRLLAKEEGILAGISSGAALYAAHHVARRKDSKGKMIVVVLPDTGERYLSTDIFKM
ncbi:MAG: cysteine synthase A [Candidatus Omnitrophica bacterium]|nr:cysteine synthase A [Candidatus Omnitrophota bacterium]